MNCAKKLIPPNVRWTACQGTSLRGGLTRSRCLSGKLALHVACIPGDLSRLTQLDQFDAANANFEPAMTESKEALMNAFRKSLSDASEHLG